MGVAAQEQGAGVSKANTHGIQARDPQFGGHQGRKI
jgi:hypothetical protein